MGFMFYNYDLAFSISYLELRLENSSKYELQI